MEERSLDQLEPESKIFQLNKTMVKQVVDDDAMGLDPQARACSDLPCWSTCFPPLGQGLPLRHFFPITFSPVLSLLTRRLA